MQFLRRHIKFLAVAVSSVAIGAGASAIASAGAASNDTGSATASVARHHWRGALFRRAVHADLVVATRSGFRIVVVDRGFVQSVSGQNLTIREGTKNATYRTFTLTIPAGAEVRNNRQPATLGALQAGEHVLVIRGPNETYVIARSA
jgi:hypothetical protein